MSERAQLDHVLLDVNFSDKATIRAFRRRFGYLAELWLIKVLAAMSAASMGRIQDDAALCIAEDMGMQSGQEMIDYCLTTIDPDTGSSILMREKGLLTNSRVIKDQTSLAAKRATSKEKQERYRNKTVTSPVTLPEKAVTPDTDTVTDTEYRSLRKGTPPPVGFIDVQGAHIPEPEYEQAHANLASAGLGEHMRDAVLAVVRHYEKPEHAHKKPNWGLDLCAPWVKTELYKLQAARTRAQSTGPPAAGREAAVRARIRQRETMKLERKNNDCSN